MTAEPSPSTFFFFRIAVTTDDFNLLRRRFPTHAGAKLFEYLIAQLATELRGDGACPTCSGSGVYRDPTGGPAEPCPTCHGTGRVA